MATKTRSRSNPARSNAARHTSEYGLRVTKGWRGANYAYPRGVGADRGKRPSYPIRPKSRARAARTYAARRGTAGSLSHVDNAIRHVYGSVRSIYSGRGGGHGRATSSTRSRSTRSSSTYHRAGRVGTRAHGF